MSDDLVRLNGVVCILGGTEKRSRPLVGLPEDSPALESIEAFRDFLRIAPPPSVRDESAEDYCTRIGRDRWVAWRFTCRNDPGLRSYVSGGEWL